MVDFCQGVLMLKGIIKSKGFKIYFWLVLGYVLLIYLCMFVFFLSTDNWTLEPGSLRETVFIAVANFITLSFLWIIALRHRRITGKQMKKIVKIFLIIYSMAFIVFLISMPILLHNN